MTTRTDDLHDFLGRVAEHFELTDAPLGEDARRLLWNADEYPDGHNPFCRKDCDHPCHGA